MKRQSILFILLLLLTCTIFCSCAAAKSPNESSSIISTDTSAEESILDTCTAETEEAVFDIALEESSIANEDSLIVSDVSGIFEGLEDNHTALFSFDGIEVVFFFEDPAVRSVLSEAVIGSTYTLSYRYDAELDFNIIYEISE